MPRLWQIVLIVSTVVFCWLGGQAVHELSHLLHVVLARGGGRIVAVELHPLHFSRTTVFPNPHPQFVAWGGAIWGGLLPMAVFALARAIRWRYGYLARFFAGFCLVLNGGYLERVTYFPATRR